MSSPILSVSFVYFTPKPDLPYPDPDSDTPEGKNIKCPQQQWLFLDLDTVDERLRYHLTLNKQLKDDAVFLATSLYLDHAKEYPIKTLVTQPWPPVILAKAPEFKTKALAWAPGYKGVAYGWSMEGDVPMTGLPGRTGIVFVAFIGWSSVGAHKRFRETEVFRENIGLLEDVKDPIKLDCFHLACKSLEVPDS
ncbi:hypothetical protein CMUS01_08852 [Colletotrichum musicola]|uniref:Uncharacterized protein n=1 Tax=Colletotrichum musicola TaxID=2175873 RepID=A0A8H6KA49_9PEZI|nr:hypothetical protein CMUS01_08852 [Colletotrichum musicola]